MLIIYKEQLHDYYCHGEVKDRVERFDGVIYDDSELPAPKDPEKAGENEKPLVSNSEGEVGDEEIACQEEVVKRANGATTMPIFRHPRGFNCICTHIEGRWNC